MRRFFFASLLVFAVVSSASAQNLLNNFSFESPSGQNFGITGSTVAVGFNTSTTWNVTSGSVDIVPASSSGYWKATAADGIQVLDLSGSSRGTIQQTITLPTGMTTGRLTFSYSRNLDYSGTGIFTGQVRIFNGSTTYLSPQTFTRNASSDGATTTNFNWSTFSQDFTITGSPTTIKLEFSDLTSSSVNAAQGIVLDNIRLIPTPEAASLFCLAVTGVAVCGRRFFRKKR